MYLTERLQDFSGDTFSMVGLFPFDAVMDKSSAMIGYRNLEVKTACLLGQPGVKARGHEFHYSSLRPLDSAVKAEFTCGISDVTQSRQGEDGLKVENTLALYTHIHFGSQPSLARSLVNAARLHSTNRVDSGEGIRTAGNHG